MLDKEVEEVLRKIGQAIRFMWKVWAISLLSKEENMIFLVNTSVIFKRHYYGC